MFLSGLLLLLGAVLVTESDIFCESEPCFYTDLIKNQYGSDVYELVQLYSKLNEAGKNKIMEELRDTAALPKYTEPVKRDAQKMA